MFGSSSEYSTAQHKREKASALSIIFGLLATLSIFVAVFTSFLIAPLAVLFLAAAVYFLHQKSKDNIKTKEQAKDEKILNDELENKKEKETKTYEFGGKPE